SVGLARLRSSILEIILPVLLWVMTAENLVWNHSPVGLLREFGLPILGKKPLIHFRAIQGADISCSCAQHIGHGLLSSTCFRKVALPSSIFASVRNTVQ